MQAEVEFRREFAAGRMVRDKDSDGRSIIRVVRVGTEKPSGPAIPTQVQPAPENAAAEPSDATLKLVDQILPGVVKKITKERAAASGEARPNPYSLSTSPPLADTLPLWLYQVSGETRAVSRRKSIYDLRTPEGGDDSK
jgi:hypothetical protein